MDADKINTLIYENAHKYRLHLDNLRWTLSGGYAAYFLASILLLGNDKVVSDPTLVANLLVLLAIFGTFYFFPLALQHWYFNAWAAYSDDCDRKLVEGKPLSPKAKFDRSKVGVWHPAFIFVLLLVSSGNAFYVFRALLGAKYSVCVSLFGAVFYIVIIWAFMIVFVYGVRREPSGAR